MFSYNRLREIARIRLRRWKNNRQVRNIAIQVGHRSQPGAGVQPVIFFNASTRLVGMSLNASYSLLTSWALRLQVIPVIYYVCNAGMSRCVLGINRDDFQQPPPCRACKAQSRWLFSRGDVRTFGYSQNSSLLAALQNLSLAELIEFEYPFTGGNPSSPTTLPLGKLILPSIRWVLRRHNLIDDEPTRHLYQEYILSAYNLAQDFNRLLENTPPQAVVLFNGQFFPEATARWIANRYNIMSITHEVGLQPFSAFFTTGEATAYPLEIPASFELSPQQNKKLDDYLEQRFHGQFSMAGIRFWPEMKGLDQAFERKAAGFKQIVPVFTNVIFDTSQPHSNAVFPDMFAWLDLVLKIAAAHPETLFVIRAHPDENRPGKESRESVQQWAEHNKVADFPNIIYIGPGESLSSYELIQRSKFVMIYNSTIGLEASLMGAAVLCAGRARFTQLDTVFFPQTIQEFSQSAEQFLNAPAIQVPLKYKHNARRFLYYQLYRSSLPFGDFIEPDLMPGFVHLRPFALESLSPSLRLVTDGILHGRPFLLEDQDEV